MLPPISLWTSLSLLFIHVLHLTCLFCTNTSYLGYYRSPSFKDLNTSTLPCIHHILPESARYTMWKHTDDSFFLCFYKLKKKKKNCKRHLIQDYNTSQHGTISLLILISIHTISTHTPLFFKPMNLPAHMQKAFTVILFWKIALSIFSTQ